jgi:hypothetical protein
MLVKDSKGLGVEISVYGSCDDDIQIDSAVYVSTGLDVDDTEIDFIQDTYASEIYDYWFENQVGAAESYCEGDR